MELIHTVDGLNIWSIETHQLTSSITIHVTLFFLNIEQVLDTGLLSLCLLKRKAILFLFLFHKWSFGAKGKNVQIIFNTAVVCFIVI